MLSPGDATLGVRSSRCSGQTAGQPQLTGRPTAEAVEEFPRVVPQQRRLQSFSSNAAEIGSVELQDLASVDLAQFKDPSPTAVVTPSSRWSAAGISENPAAAKDAAISNGMTRASDVELCRKAQAASGVGVVWDSGRGTTAAKAVVPDKCLRSDKSSKSNVFSSLKSKRHSTKSSANLGPVTPSTAPPAPSKPRPTAPPQTLATKTTAPAGPTPTAATTPETLWPYIQQHGRGIMTISTLQEGLQYFVMPGVGYIAYSMMNNGPDFLNILTPVALGDPVCDASNYGLMAAEFLKRHPKAMFLQISKEFGFILRGLGMLVNSVGGETQLNLEKYTFSGYAKRGLRSAISSAVKEGITVQEVMKAPMGAQKPPAAAAEAAAGGSMVNGAPSSMPTTVEWPQIAKEMIAVDRQWVKNKGSHAGRVWFVKRPPVFAPEPSVRKFTAHDRSGSLVAFIFFDAVYDQGSTIGYYANVTRMRPDAHPGALNLIMSKFIDIVRSESKLTAPAKNISTKKSQRKQKQQKQPSAAAPAADTAAEQPTGNSSSSSSSTMGPKFLSLGLSPLYQMQDGAPFSYSRFIHRLFEFCFKQGSGYYPFSSLAAAKAKYGAGLHHGVYEDPNVTYQQVYLAHTHRMTACATMFDLGKMIGFWSSPWDAATAFSGHKISGGRRILTNKISNKIKQIREGSKGSSTSSTKGAGPGNPSKGSAACSSSGRRSRCAARSKVCDHASDHNGSALSKVSTSAPDHRCGGSNSSSCDSGDSSWRSRCLILSLIRRKQHDLDSTASTTSTAAAAAVDSIKKAGTGPAGSRGCSKPCMFRKGQVLLPLVRPVAPQPPASGPAAAAAPGGGNSTVPGMQMRGADAPAGCSTDPEITADLKDVSDTSSGSGYISTAACATSATSSSLGSSSPAAQD